MKTRKAILIKRESKTHSTDFYLSDNDSYISWTSYKPDARRFSTIEDAMHFIENERDLEEGFYHTEVLIEKYEI